MEEKKKTKEGKGFRGVWPMLLCLVLAGGIFVFLLNLEARELARYEKGKVVVAIADVEQEKEITKENLAEYFGLEERPLTDIPEAAYFALEDLIGQYAKSGIDKGNMVTKGMLGELQVLAEDAVLIGVDMESLSQSVAGILRAGDCVDIYTVKEEGEKVVVEKVLARVTIERSYTGAGVAIPKEDRTLIAQYITLPVHKEAVGSFYKALEDGRIQIVKHP